MSSVPGYQSRGRMAIARGGQISAQTAQLMHACGSTTGVSPLMVRHAVGQSGTQSPQLVQVLVSMLGSS